MTERGCRINRHKKKKKMEKKVLPALDDRFFISHDPLDNATTGKSHLCVESGPLYVHADRSKEIKRAPLYSFRVAL